MKTATIHPDRAVDHWLTGTASPTDAPPFGRALDSLLGEAPDAAEWEAVGRRLKTNKLVVKAQIHAGGRGKAGGVKLGASASSGEAYPPAR